MFSRNDIGFEIGIRNDVCRIRSNNVKSSGSGQKVYPWAFPGRGKTGSERPQKRLSKFDPFRTTREAASEKPEIMPFLHYSSAWDFSSRHHPVNERCGDISTVDPNDPHSCDRRSDGTAEASAEEKPRPE